MSFRLPAYLHLSRHNVFYFRIAVPTGLRLVLCKREIRISLLTSDRRTSIVEARKWKVRFDDWFETIANMELPSPKLIRITNSIALYSVWIEVPSSSGWRCRQEYVSIPVAKDISAFNVRVNADGSVVVEEIPDDVSAEQAEKIANNASKIAEKIRESIAESQPSSKPVTHKKGHSPSPAREEKLVGDINRSEERMSFILTKYLKEKTTSGKRLKARWNAKTAQQNMSRLRLIQVYFDDPILRSLAPLDITKMKEDFLHHLPKGLLIDGMSHGQLQEVITLQKKNGSTLQPMKEVIDIATLNQYLSRLSGFMEWCVNNGYIDSNVAYKKTIPMSSDDDDDESRVPWNGEELREIFESRFYSEHMYVHAYQYWLPILALYTGARINELAQLHTTDIVKDTESAIWCIEIYPDVKLGQKVKNKRARRLVPIHDKVIELGFINFVKERAVGRKEEESIQLFTGLTLQRDGYGKNASRWFNETYKGYLGYGANDGRVFHSFRRNVIDQLKQSLLRSDIAKQIDKKDIITKAIVGHKSKFDITWDHYAGDFRPAVLKPVVDQLSWPVSFAQYKTPNPEAARRRLKLWVNSIPSLDAKRHSSVK